MDTTKSVNQSQSTANFETLTTESQNTSLSPSVISTAPGQLKIIKRNGAVVFDDFVDYPIWAIAVADERTSLDSQLFFFPPKRYVLKINESTSAQTVQ